MSKHSLCSLCALTQRPPSPSGRRQRCTRSVKQQRKREKGSPRLSSTEQRRKQSGERGVGRGASSLSPSWNSPSLSPSLVLLFLLEDAVRGNKRVRGDYWLGEFRLSTSRSGQNWRKKTSFGQGVVVWQKILENTTSRRNVVGKKQFFHFPPSSTFFKERERERERERVPEAGALLFFFLPSRAIFLA